MIQALFKFYAASALGQAFRHSSWAFAVTEMFHLLALAALGGGLLVAAIGLSGLGLQLPDRFGGWRGLRLFLAWSLGATFVSGVLLVGTNPLKYYFNDAFRVKMALLATGLVLAVMTDALVRRSWPRVAAVAGFLTLGAWLAIGLAGRLIGLL